MPDRLAHLASTSSYRHSAEHLAELEAQLAQILANQDVLAAMLFGVAQWANRAHLRCTELERRLEALEGKQAE